MSTVTIKIKRRASSGSAGAPGSLKSGELAFNENTSDKKLYYGYGDDGSGNATSIISIAGENIPNSGLANSSVTINGNSLALGGSLTLTLMTSAKAAPICTSPMLALVVQFLSRTPVVTDRLHPTAQLVLSRTPGLLLQKQERTSQQLVGSSTTALPALSRSLPLLTASLLIARSRLTALLFLWAAPSRWIQEILAKAPICITQTQERVLRSLQPPPRASATTTPLAWVRWPMFQTAALLTAASRSMAALLLWVALLPPVSMSATGPLPVQ